MNATLVFATQFTLCLLSCGLIARGVIYPRPRERSLRDALTPVLLFETLRTIGLIFIVPGLVDDTPPSAFTVPRAVGDKIAVVLAFVTLVAVRSGWRVAPALVGLFSAEGLADFINATAQGLRFNIAANYHLGLAWLIPTSGLPAVVAVQLTVIAVLLNGARREHQRARDQAAQAVTAPDRLMASLS